MANPFQRYQSGGFEAVPGIAQAGANIGQMLGSGFSNFGSAIGSGIKQYYENKAKSTAAMQEIEVLGPQLLARRNAYLEASGIDPATLDRYMQDDPSEGTDDEMFKSVASNPMVQLAKTLDPAIEALKNAPTKGLSAQLAALNSGKAAIGMVDEQIKLQDFVSKYRLEQVTNDLPDSVATEQNVVTPDALFDPNNPLFANLGEVRKALEETYPNNPEFVERGVKQYLDKAGAKIRADESIGTPEQRASLIDALNRYAEGKLDIKGELTPVGESYEYQEESARQDKFRKEALAEAKATAEGKSKGRQPSADVQALIKKRDERLKYAAGFDDPKNVEKDPVLRKEQERMRDKANADAKALETQIRSMGGYDNPEGTPEPDALKKMAESAATNINTKRQAEAEGKKQGAAVKDEVRQAVLNIVSNNRVPNLSNFVREKGRIIQEMGLTWDGDSYVDKNGKNMDWVDAAINKEYEMLLDAMDMGSLKGLTNPAREKEMVEALRSNPEFQTRVLGAIPQSKARAEKLATEGQKLADTKPTTAGDVLAKAAEKTQPTTPAVKSKTFNVGELELGTEIVDRRLNAAEKETAAREFYSKRFGSVPPGFTQMYRQMFPEASVRTTEVNGIPVMVDGKGNVTALTSGNQQSNKEIAENKAVTFQNTEIADGVVLNGIFSGTVAGAQSFRKDYSHMANVRSAVDELIKINEMGYETLSPTARARADQLQSEIIAAMRIPIVGPGQVAIPEQQILERIIQKGTGFFTLESGERAALKGLKDRMERELVNWPKSMGLEVKIGGKSSDTIKALRMQKLRSSRNLKPIGEVK
jgi:hypothetical protein